MNDIEKARAWVRGMGLAEFPYTIEDLAAYGAHCAREAEQERDALAAQVSDCKRAWGMFYQFAHAIDWAGNDDGETAWSNAWTEMEMGIHQPTTPRVQLVAAGMALADSCGCDEYDEWFNGKAYDAYRAGKEAAK